MVPAGNKAKRLSSVKHTTKTIHHHHHHHVTKVLYNSTFMRDVTINLVFLTIRPGRRFLRSGLASSSLM